MDWKNGSGQGLARRAHAAFRISARSARAARAAERAATATVIGIVVLRQFPTAAELAGVALVVIGVGLHQAEK